MLDKKQELEKKIAALEAEREELERLAEEMESDEDFDIDEYEDDHSLNGVPYNQLSFIGKIRCKMKPFLRKVYKARCICSFAALTALLPGILLGIQMLSAFGNSDLNPIWVAVLMLLMLPGVLCGWFAAPRMMLGMLFGTPILCAGVGFVIGFVFFVGVGCLFGAAIGFMVGIALGIFFVTGGAGLISTIYFFRELRSDMYAL